MAAYSMAWCSVRLGAICLALAACSSGSSSSSGGGAAAAGAGGSSATGGNGAAAGASGASGGASGAGGVGGASGGASGAGGGGGASGGASGAGGASGGASGAGGAGFALPPSNGGLDYQLGGAYPPPAGVTIVSRDRTAAPAVGLYNLCYVNGFQIQPDEESLWLTQHPELILRDGAGDPIVDPDWDEMMIDVGTVAKRTAVAAIVGPWIAGCAASGFDAVEIDNLDSFSRSGGRLTEDDAVAAMRLFADVAHAEGLAIAQKNSAELVGRRGEMGTDFVVAEECNRWSECEVYTGAYGDAVLVIEYRRADFDQGCASFPNLSIVLRDLNLVTPSSGSYVYDGC
ncbi:MAG: endo alpha-1,4 polygalactosaminidase [Polyangiaceae bacterium]|nr:endo alpha-1,4 polygalactosaminidase [Polyangiaceae bacterium]